MLVGKMAESPCTGEQLQLSPALQQPNPAATAADNPAAAAAAALLPSQLHACEIRLEDCKAIESRGALLAL